MSSYSSATLSGGLILLDTHYWIWMQSDDRRSVPGKTLRAVERAARSGNLVLSVISIWEVGMLEAKGRIHLRMGCEQWVKGALAMPGLTVAPLTPEIAIESTRLPGTFHADPADRIIVATARSLGAKLATRDERILHYAGGRHVTIV